MGEKNFTVFPAIDLRGGQVVRLKEGDPRRLTNYGSNPAQAVQRWVNAGATWLHVVNLDGAFAEAENANYQALGAILAESRQSGVLVQFGGGLRTREAIQSAFDLGVTRVVLGTVVVEQPEVLSQALAQWGNERIAASLDAREGRVQIRGWQSDTPLLALELVQRLQQAGLRWLVFTDIARDGLQTGLNLPATTHLAQISGLQVIASGGVSQMEDVQAAKAASLAGAIVGRALYEGGIDPVKLFALNTAAENQL